MILFCCVGNAFQSPLLAALYNAEAKARGLSARATSAGLSNRRELPPTTVFLLEAVAREVRDLPAVYAEVSLHRPTPLKSLAISEMKGLSGVSYLYDPARKPHHRAEDAKVIERWLAAAPGTPVIELAIKDAGYEAWDRDGRPSLDSPAGQSVLSVYMREVGALRTLARALVAAAAPSEATAPKRQPEEPIRTVDVVQAPPSTPSSTSESEVTEHIGPTNAPLKAKRPSSARAQKPRKTDAPLEPEAKERADALDDVRAWIRAALPLSRTTLTRYGLWKRAEQHFGSWEGAIAASGIAVAKEPLWMLPRDRELSLDILIEALPDANVARLSGLSLPKIRARRRANGAPDAARQLSRRVVATDLLGGVPDEAIAAQLGVPVEAIVRIREAEEIAPPA